MRRRELVQSFALPPLQEPEQDLLEVEPRQMVATGDAREPRSEPIAERGTERGVVDLRPPLTRALVVARRECNARPERERLARPGQRGESELADAVEHCCEHALRRRRIETSRLELECVEPAFAYCDD